MSVNVRVIQTTPEQLSKIVTPIVSTAVEEQMNNQRDLDSKQEQINKILKRDTIAKEANAKSKEKHKHDNSCPDCNGDMKKLDDTVKICKSCGDTTLKKGADYLICETCGGIIPASFGGTSQLCPHCGGNKARKP